MFNVKPTGTAISRQWREGGREEETDGQWVKLKTSLFNCLIIGRWLARMWMVACLVLCCSRFCLSVLFSSCSFLVCLY